VRRARAGEDQMDGPQEVSAAFASILAITHLAGVVFEAVAVLGVFAVDLLTGQIVARMDRRERNKLAKAA
jgi:hypothetical protein